MDRAQSFRHSQDSDSEEEEKKEEAVFSFQVVW